MGATSFRGCANICRGEVKKYLDQREAHAPARAVEQAGSVRSTARVLPQYDATDGFGGKAPICPPPAQQRSSGLITLEVLQGQWLSGNGTQISVVGTAVYMNGVPLRDQRVELHEDGTIRGIGQRLQVDGWTEGGGVQFRANSAGGQNMEFAPKEVWTRDSAESRDEKLRLLGYAGTAASFQAGTRGVEGCIPGTLCQLMPASKDKEDVQLLQTLISQWREPVLCNVLSCEVVPDFINRENTGVGVELVHYIAISIRDKGFKKRQDRTGHDVPVVVREPPGTASHQEAIRTWKERVAEEEGFPPVRIREDQAMFTSLGNGHFFQALNLYACQCPGINESESYSIGDDKALHDAITIGVPSVVLKSATPRPVRAKIASLLNAKFEFRWTLRDDGTLDVSEVQEDNAYTPQFDSMSKHLDAVVVNSLVRSHLGIKESKRIQG